MIRLFTFLLLAVLSFQSFGAILFRGDFESGSIKPSGGTIDSFQYSTLQSPCSFTSSTQSTGYPPTDKLKVVTSPVRHGTYAHSQTLIRNCDYRVFNSNVYQKPRMQIQVNASSFAPQRQTEYWYGFSIFIPENYVHETDHDQDWGVFQHHQVDRNAGPPVSQYDTSKSCCFLNIQMEPNKFLFEIENLHTAGSTTGSVTYESTANKTYAWTATKGVWHDVVVNFKACNIIEKTAGCDPFVHLYVSVGGASVNANGASNSTPVKSFTGKANTNSVGAFDRGPVFNVYKHQWNCLGTTAQKDFNLCTANKTGGTNPTTNPSSVTLYFDEILIGNSASSLSEVSPWLGAAGAGGAELVSVNGGLPIAPNIPAAAAADPVYFQTSGADTNGVAKVVISDGSTSQDAIAVNSNATGGRFSTGDFAGFTSPNGTATIHYDNTMQVDTKGAAPFSGWILDGVSTAPYAPGGNLDYGYTNGVTITSTETTLYKTLKTAEFAVTAGQTVTVRAVVQAGTSGKVLLRMKERTAASVTTYAHVTGTLGSLPTTPNTADHGTGHQITETVHNGLSFVEWKFTNSGGGILQLMIGTGGTVIGQTVNALGARIWLNETLETLSRPVQLSIADTVSPGLFDCQIGETTTPAVFNLGCLQSESNGTFYAVISTSTTAPTLAQVKAGQDHSGASALWSGSQPATSGTFTTSALNPYVQKCAYFAQTDAAANDSVVVAGEACIPTDPFPVVKKIKFSDTNTRLRKRDGTVFNDTLDFFTLHPTDPRLPGPKVDLVYIDNPSIPAGVIDFDETDVQCGTCSGSINALTAGTYWYSARSTDGTVKSVNTISVVVE